MPINITDCAAELPRSSACVPSWYTLNTSVVVACTGPPLVDASMIANVSKNAYTTFTTIRKNVVGDRSGNTIVQKRRAGPAPSIAAASTSERGIAWSDEPGLVALAANLPIRFEAASEAGGPRVLYDGRDVTQAIRTPEISEGSSQVSALPAVRASLLEIQRRLGRDGCVAEGRDLGTVVFPDAAHKFFLTADPTQRALRRKRELEARGQYIEVDEMLTQLRDRDQRDATRSVAPLKPAEDAVLLDTTHLSEGEVLDRLEQIVRQRMPPETALK